MTLPTQLRHPTLNVIRTSVTGRTTDYSPDPMHMNASLWDFDINGSQLKADHYRWLAMAVDRVNTANRSLIWHIWINGGASLTGIYIRPNNGWNYALARARAAEVYKFLTDNLSVLGLVFHGTDTAGIELAVFKGHRRGVENDEDRAVYVRITTDSTPPPPPPTPTSIPVSKNWAIRFVKGSTAGVFVVGVDLANFEIADTDNHLYAHYGYKGDSIGYSPMGDVSVSYTFKGNWSEFKTDGALNVCDFDGPCRFNTAGGLSLTVNNLILTPAGGVTTIPPTLPIDTGTTLGAGFSATIPGTGWLSLKAGPAHYSGTFPP